MSYWNKKYKFKPYPGKGQNFLIDQNYVLKILSAVNPDPEDRILEIGPGFGILTIPLSKKVSRLIAIEWDNRLVEYLKIYLSDVSERVSILQGDIMKADIPEILGRFNAPPIILGNLPYYLATPLIQRLIFLGPAYIKKMIFMIQKEVAERIIARPFTKSYGYLSLVVKYFANAKILLDVPPYAFKPRPKVQSSIILLEPLNRHPVNVVNEKIFFRIIKSAFMHRRKTLINSIKLDPFFKSTDIEKVCQDLGIKRDARPEALALEEFAQISNAATV